MILRRIHRATFVILALLAAGLATLHAQDRPIVGTQRLRMFSRGDLWSPTALASTAGTVLVWLDAADSSTFTLSGNRVSQWNDKSGGNRHVTQAAAAQQPIRVPTSQNFLPVVVFDGSNDFMSNATLPTAGLTSVSVIAVFLVNSGGATEDVIAGIGQTGGTGAVRGFYRAPSGTTVGFAGWAADVVSSALSYDIAGSHHVFGFVQNGLAASNNVTLLRDGATELRSTTAALITSSAGFSVGSLQGAAVGSYYSDVSVAEIIVINGALPAFDRQRVEGYLAWKWGLQSQLAAGHPHRTSPPLAAGVPLGSGTFETPTLGASFTLEFDDVLTTRLSNNAVSLGQGSVSSPRLTWTNGSVTENDVFRMSDAVTPVPGWFPRNDNIWYTRGGNPSSGGSLVSSGALGSSVGLSGWLGTQDATAINFVTNNTVRALMSSDGSFSVGSTLFANVLASTNLVAITPSAGAGVTAPSTLLIRSPNTITMGTWATSTGAQNPDSNTVVGARTLESTTYTTLSRGNSILGARAALTGIRAGLAGATLANLRLVTGINNTLVGNSVVTVTSSGGNAAYVGAFAGQSSGYTMGDVAIGSLAASNYNITAANLQNSAIPAGANPTEIAPLTAIGMDALRGFTTVGRPHHVALGTGALGYSVSTWSGSREVVAIGTSAGANMASPPNSSFYLSNRATGNFLLAGGLEFPRLQVNAPANVFNLTTGSRNPNTIDAVVMVNAIANVDDAESVDPDPLDQYTAPTLSSTTPTVLSPTLADPGLRLTVQEPLPTNADMADAIVSGTTTVAVGGTTVTDATKAWVTNQWAGYRVVVTSAGGTAVQQRVITSNTGTVLTVSPAGMTAYPAGARYWILPSMFETERPSGNDSLSTSPMTQIDLMGNVHMRPFGTGLGAFESFGEVGEMRFYDRASFEVGTATSAAAIGTSALVDAGKAWTANSYQAAIIRIIDGPGEGQVRRISSHTTNTITVNSPWTTALVAGLSRYEIEIVAETGIVTSIPSTIQLTDASKDWTAENLDFSGAELRIVGGTGVGQIRTVVSNTANTLTLNSTWSVTPNTTSVYQISRYFPRYVGFRPGNDLATPTNNMPFNPFMKLPDPSTIPPGARSVLAVASTDGEGTLIWATNVGLMAFDQTWDNRAAAQGETVDDTPYYGWPTTGYGFGSTGAAEQSMIFGTMLTLTGPNDTPPAAITPRADFITGLGWGLMTGLDNVADAGNNSVGFGHNVMRAMTTGAENVGLGKLALENVTTGSENTAIGYNTLSSITTGTGFVAIGASALASAVVATPSVAIGHSALGALTTGVRNVAVGEGALRSATTVNDVVAIGTSAASSMIMGSQSVIAGSDAALVMTSCSDCVLMGASIAPSLATGNRVIAVGVGALNSAVNVTNQIAIGEGALRSLVASSEGFNVAIGSSAMANSTNTSRNVAIGESALLNVSAGINNVAIGSRAMPLLTTGSRNFAIGSSAGSNLLSGNDNFLIGTSAGSSLTVGSRNFAIGLNALAALVNQDENIAIGVNALFSLTNGTNNIVVGFQAANSLQNGQYNVVAGPQTMRQMTTGQYNIMLGSSAGRVMLTGDDNIAIGSLAMGLSTGTNQNMAFGVRALRAAGSGTHNVAFGNDALLVNAVGSSNLAFGTLAGSALTSGDENVAIGDQALDVLTSGSRNLAIGQAALGSFLSGDQNVGVGSSVMALMTSGSSQIAIGERALSSLVNGLSATSNIIIGSSAGSLMTSGSNNIVLGVTAFGATGGSENVAIGFDAMRGAGSAPSTNVGLGVRAMRNVSTGQRNVGLGVDALAGTLTGSQNVAIGSSAGTGLTTGADNVVIGDQALRTGIATQTTIAMGQLAARDLVSGSMNIAVGQNALLVMTSGSSHIAIGQRALSGLVNGVSNTFNIAIGSSAGSVFTAGSSNIAIGQLAYAGSGGGSRSIAIGTEAMRSATTGSDNVALGQRALRSVTSGASNIAIGQDAMGTNTITGASNVAIGSSAGSALSGVAEFNSLIGRGAGSTITTGARNVAVGSNTLRTTTASDNVAIGRDALSTANTGASNVAVGHRAMAALAAGDNNVAIGHATMVGATGTSSNVAIGQSTLTTLTTGSSSNVAIGTSAGRAITTGTNNVAVGQEALWSAITSGSSNVMVGTSAGRALSGTGSRNIGLGSDVMRALTSGDNVIAIGFEALVGATASITPSIAIGNQAMIANVASSGGNIAVGSQALSAVTSSLENIALGDGAMFSLATGAGRSIAIGQNAMRTGTDASSSIAIGRDALVNARGTGNIAIGGSALRTTSATLGSDNIAIGMSALELATDPRRNVAVGSSAAYNVTTGTGNIVVGQSALLNSTAADNNIALGQSALSANATGADNVAIGSGAMASLTTGAMSGNVAVGARSLESMSEGTFNTVVGAQALSSALTLGTSGGRNVALGYQAGKRPNADVNDRLFIANGETKALLYGEFATGRLATNVDMPADGSLPTLDAAMRVNSSDPVAPGIAVRLAADQIELAFVIENASATTLFEINSAGEISKTASASYTWPTAPPDAYAAGVAMGRGMLTANSVPELSWTQASLPAVLLENVTFPDVDPNSSQDVVIVTDVLGAAVGDAVGLGVPAACGLLPLVTFHAWVSAADEVTIRINNLSDTLVNPPDDQEFKIVVIK